MRTPGVKLRLPGGCDEALAEARAEFLRNFGSELGIALKQGAALAAEARREQGEEDKQAVEESALAEEIARLEEEVSSAELRAAERRDEVSRLQADLGLLQLSALNPPQPQPESDMVIFQLGGSVLLPSADSSPVSLQAVAACGSGRLVAFAVGEEVILCEADCSGFRRIAQRTLVEGERVSWLRFLDEDMDDEALLLVAGDRFLGWEPVLPLDDGAETRVGDGACGSPVAEEEIFMMVAASGHIVAASYARGPGDFFPPELLMLVTASGTVEIWDLCLSRTSAPQMLSSVHMGGGIVGIALADDASKAVFAILDQSDTGVVAESGAADEGSVGHVSPDISPLAGASLRVFSALGEGNTFDRYEAELRTAALPGRTLRLAYCARALVWAVAAGNGVVEVFLSTFLGGAVAQRNYWEDAPCGPEASAAAAAERAEATTGEAADSLPHVAELAWCAASSPQEPTLLAVGGRPDVVVVYRYYSCSYDLEPVARLPLLCPPSARAPRSLSWAPTRGALFAGFGGEFQYWLLDREATGERLGQSMGEEGAPAGARGHAFGHPGDDELHHEALFARLGEQQEERDAILQAAEEEEEVAAVLQEEAKQNDSETEEEHEEENGERIRRGKVVGPFVPISKLFGSGESSDEGQEHVMQEAGWAQVNAGRPSSNGVAVEPNSARQRGEGSSWSGVAAGSDPIRHNAESSSSVGAVDSRATSSNYGQEQLGRREPEWSNCVGMTREVVQSSGDDEQEQVDRHDAEAGSSSVGVLAGSPRSSCDEQVQFDREPGRPPLHGDLLQGESPEDFPPAAEWPGPSAETGNGSDWPCGRSLR